MFKVCSYWSCAFLALCSSEHMCARKSAFFILPRNSDFRAISFFLLQTHFPANVFHEITGITDVLKKNAHD